MKEFEKGEIVSFIDEIYGDSVAFRGRIVENADSLRYLLRLDDDREIKIGHRASGGSRTPRETANYWFVRRGDETLKKVDIDKLEVLKSGDYLILKYFQGNQVMMTEKAKEDPIESLENAFKDGVKPHLQTSDGEVDGYVGDAVGRYDMFGRELYVGDVAVTIDPDEISPKCFVGNEFIEFIDRYSGEYKILRVKEHTDLNDGEEHNGVKAFL